MLARAYWDKGAWREAIERADKAIAINAVERAGAPVARRRAAASWPRRKRTPTRQLRLYADRARRLSHVPRPDEFLERPRLEARVPLHRVRRRQPPPRRSPGRVRQPAQRRVPRACACRSRRSAIRSRRASTASGRCSMRRRIRSRTSCSATSIATSYNVAAVVRRSEGRQNSYLTMIDAQSGSQRVEKRAELRVANRRPAAAPAMRHSRIVARISLQR